jgi:hypothetical protein
MFVGMVSQPKLWKTSAGVSVKKVVGEYGITNSAKYLVGVMYLSIFRILVKRRKGLHES